MVLEGCAALGESVVEALPGVVRAGVVLNGHALGSGVGTVQVAAVQARVEGFGKGAGVAVGVDQESECVGGCQRVVNRAFLFNACCGYEQQVVRECLDGSQDDLRTGVAAALE